MRLEKKSLEDEFEASSALANGDVDEKRRPLSDMHPNPDDLYILAENFDHFKRTLLEERAYEARLRKYVRRRHKHLAPSVSGSLMS